MYFCPSLLSICLVSVRNLLNLDFYDRISMSLRMDVMEYIHEKNWEKIWMFSRYGWSLKLMGDASEEDVIRFIMKNGKNDKEFATIFNHLRGLYPSSIYQELYNDALDRGLTLHWDLCTGNSYLVRSSSKFDF